MAEKPLDDGLTLAALGILAFVIADVTHEALGHGLATLAVGGEPILLTTSYFSSRGSVSRWIPAGGGIANVVVGCLFAVASRQLRSASAPLRYFVVLGVAFNLLFAAAYPFYSGLAAFGDWAAVIAGLAPAWFWRTFLVGVSVSAYYLTLRLLAGEMRSSCGSTEPTALARLQRMTLIPYLAALATAALGGSLNPRGWANILTAAVPAAAAAFGLTQLDHFPAVRSADRSIPECGPITRSYAWIVAAAIALAIFVGVLGPGVSLSSTE